MKPLDLIQLQIKLEYKLNLNGWLVPFPESSEQASYIVYRHARGFEPFFNYLLPPDLGERLLKIGPATAFIQPQTVRKLINSYYRPYNCGEELHWAGYFEYPPAPTGSATVSRKKDAWIIELEGQIVCQAVSVRQNELCAEVYVETHPDFRRKGYGKQTTAAWARDTLISGRIPFYSYRRTNTASAALAKSLRVRWYADVAVFGPA